MAQPLFAALEDEFRLPTGLLDSVWSAESSRGQNMLSPKGAKGHFGFMDPTAAQYGVTDPNDLPTSARGAARMYRDMIDQTGDLDSALAAYNWGIGNLQRKGIENAPAETRGYIQKVRAGMAQENDPWDELNRQFAQQTAAPARQEVDPWEQLNQQFAMPAAPAQEPPSAPQTAGGEATTSRGPDGVLRVEMGGTTAPTPAAAVEPTLEQTIVASAPMRALRGAKDILDSGAQMLANAVPTGLADAINSGTQYVNDLPVIGPVSKAFGFVPASAQELDQRLIGDEKAYQAARAATGQKGLDAYRLGGSIAATVPLLASAGGAAATLPGRLAAAAGAGGVAGMLNPVLTGKDYASEKAKQAAMGGAFGLGGGAIGATIGRLLAPGAARNPQIQALLNEGVTPTPGQLLGGVARTVEDKAISIPIVGDAIRGARTRSIQEFNEAALNRAVAPLGQRVTSTGRDGLQQAQRIVGDAYDDIVPRLNFRADNQFAQEVGTLQQMAQALPPAQAQQFERILRDQVIGRLTPQGGATGQNFRAIESELGRLGASYRSSAVAGERELGMALTELQNSLRASLTRSNPQVAQELAAINQSYSMLTRLQRAASSQGAEGGIFTPSQFSAAVRASDTTARKNAYGRGAALMQDLSDAGRSILNSQIPNSGTADRAALGLGALGAGLYSPAIPAGLLGASIPYLPGVGRVVAAAMARRPDAALRAGGLLEGGVPALGGLLGLGAVAR